VPLVLLNDVFLGRFFLATGRTGYPHTLPERVVFAATVFGIICPRALPGTEVLTVPVSYGRADYFRVATPRALNFHIAALVIRMSVPRAVL
jgi:hypothetical protein